jgi:hypothetical protein
VRVEAYERQHGIIAGSIRYISEPFDLRLASHVEHLITTVEAAGFTPDLIVLDTLARLIPGADENTSKDMGEAVSAMDTLRRHFEATVLVIHHPGKKGGPERGSGALRGAADVMIEVTSESQNTAILRCDKMKDAEEFKSLLVHFELHEIDDERTSLAVTSAGALSGLRTTNGRNTNQKNRALLILEEKFGENGATHGEWREQFERDTGKKGRTFNRELKALKQQGLVWQDGNRYYPNATAVGVRCHSVPRQCHDTSAIGVMSSPLRG